ncbi:MAG: hypothetical protein HQL98_04550 [Magnetococcales bacterium]|nr:hypothetical protein [Magnetococcales bacterium]
MDEYLKHRNNLKTGDILLFSGRGPTSWMIRLGEWSKWSHVGMVIKNDIGLFSWESTTLSNIKDASDGKEKMGVQIVSLSERIKRYDGEIAYRSLAIPKGIKIEEEETTGDGITRGMEKKLWEIRQQLRDRPYEKHKLELIKSLIDVLPGSTNKEDLSSVFCSELVAEAYQSMGLLPPNEPSNEFTPRDFSCAGRINKKLLAKEPFRASLGDEIYIKINKTI